MAAAGEAPASGREAYELVLAATDDVEQAEAAYRRHRHAELRSGRTPVE